MNTRHGNADNAEHHYHGVHGRHGDLEVFANLPLIVSARTGLAGKDDALVRKVPDEYTNKTVQEVLDYVTSKKITADESGLAESVKKELLGRQNIVMINGIRAYLTDKAGKYGVVKEHKLPKGGKKQYRELEVEISAIQQGGNYR